MRKQVINGKGNSALCVDFPITILIKCSKEFTAFINDEIVAPKKSTDRVVRLQLKANDNLEIETEGRTTLDFTEIKSSGERNSGESQVEIIEDENLNMYERMKADIMRSVSGYANEKGMDTLDEEDDYELDEEDDNQAPMTEYEYQDMVEEFYVEPEKPEENHVPEEGKEVKEHEGQQKLDLEENIEQKTA